MKSSSIRLRVGVALLAAGALVSALAPTAGAQTEAARRYIVVLEDSVQRPGVVAGRLGAAQQFTAGRTFRHALKGFTATLSAPEARALAGDPRVDFVEPDSVVRAFTTQTNATWGLDRIDQRSRPLSTTFTYTRTGAGVTAYIIDSGIRFSHADFGGRAVSGFDAVNGGSADDCNGHGTHVAGTVGGTRWGVAKGVRLVAVRVLSCNGSGTTSGVIAGIDYVTANHQAGQPAVANMSLGGGASSALDNAVQRSINDGVGYAVAAGNGNFLGMAQNACNFSPARLPAAMTIGATERSDRKATFSNYGSCVDWFAPGVGITSAWYTSNTATNTISGTSMATPHTAGVAAQYLQGNPSASPATVRNALFNLATKGIVTSSNTANNHLLFTNL